MILHYDLKLKRHFKVKSNQAYFQVNMEKKKINKKSSPKYPISTIDEVLLFTMIISIKDKSEGN